MVPGRVLSPEVMSALLTVVNVAGAADAVALSRGVGRLSEWFTRNRKALPDDYLNQDDLRRSYLAYFCPVSVGKVQAVLSELSREALQSSTSGRPFRVLDIGAGPGSAALGVLDWLLCDELLTPGLIELVLIDRSRPALREAECLLDAYRRSIQAPSLRVRTIRADLERKREWLRNAQGEDGEPYDLIVVANCLNELYRGHRDPCQARTKLVARLLDQLRDDGSLILVEPATRAESRQLHRLRDALVTRRLCTVYSPCLHEGRCPALAKEEDWCHEERPWEPPWLVPVIDRQVGLIKDALKFSYLILRKDGRRIVRRDPTVFRVVSELRHMKGERRAWLCNETGRMEVGRLDRARSETNMAFDDWHRGAIVRVSEILHKGPQDGVRRVGRIPASTPVELVRPIAGSGLPLLCKEGQGR